MLWAITLLLLLQQQAAPGLAAADRLYRSGEFRAAISAYQALLESAPRDPGLLLRLAACEYQTGDFEAAARDFRRVLTAQPGAHPALIGLGTSLIALGKARDAIPHLRKAAGLAPADTMALRSLGHALQEAGEFVEGEEVLRKLVSAGPADTEAWYYLGLLMFERNYAVPALEAFDKTLALDSSYAKARIYRAGTLAMLGRIGEARQAFSELGADPSIAADPEYLLGYAQLLAGQGTYPEAAALIERGLSADPRSPKLLFWRARILFLEAKLDQAAEAARRMVALAPEVPSGHNLLLQIYRRRGDAALAAAEAAWLRRYNDSKAKGTAR